MTNSIIFSIFSFIYVLLMFFVYFSRKRIKTVENKIYSILIIINLIGLSLEIVCTLIRTYLPVLNDISIILLKLINVYFVIWPLVFAIYIYYVIKKVKIDNKIIIGTIILLSLITISLPLNIALSKEGRTLYTYGASVTFVYSTGVVILTYCIYMLIRYKKIIEKRNLIPLMAFIFLYITIGLIEKQFPELLLVSSVETFITILMYFTIENPDMKLLKEMHDAKVISDNANEEKTLFLYNMTQEIRKTTKNINVEADNILESKDLELDKDSARNIKGETSKFTTMTNDILDVSTIDSSNIKIYNNKYNIKNIIKYLVITYQDICLNKGIEFRSNIEHNIPDMLYGDGIELKKVLTLLLNESIKNTDKGYIELNINTIIKNEIMRLIITIEDSGIGIKANELESVKINNKNISESYKAITLMNGTMILSSNYGIGTKIKIILDQKMDIHVNKEETEYNAIYDNKSILVVDDNESTYKLIEKLLKDSNINIDYSLNGKETINKIKSKNKYDLILIDEELSQITGAELLIKLKEIRNFNIPVILLTKDNNYEYSEEYLKQGFTSVIIKPLKKDNLLQVIDELTKE